MPFVVELEKDVWAAALGGDPGRTTELDSAEIFFTQSEANRKLVKCRKYRPFKNAEIVRVKIVKAD